MAFRRDGWSDALKAVTFDGATLYQAEGSTRSHRSHSHPAALGNRAQDDSHERPYQLCLVVIQQMNRAQLVAVFGLEQGAVRCSSLLHPGDHRTNLLSLAEQVWGLKIDQVKRLNELERDNSRLKRAVADLTLDKLILNGSKTVLTRLGVSNGFPVFL